MSLGHISELLCFALALHSSVAAFIAFVVSFAHHRFSRSLPFSYTLTFISFYFFHHISSFHSTTPSVPITPTFVWSPSSPPSPISVLFPGLKTSQTISSDVFCTKGQTRWGSVPGMHDAMKQQGFPSALLTKCQHAQAVSPFHPFLFSLLFSDLHHHNYCSDVWLLSGEWGNQLQRSILPFVFVSPRIIWVSVSTNYIV